MYDPLQLPEVAGRHCQVSHEDFELACQVLMAEEQAKAAPNNALMVLLCNAVRLSREHCDAVKASLADTARLNWIEKQTDGSSWVAMMSITGRGFRLHNTGKDDSNWPDARGTARGAIDVAMEEQSEGARLLLRRPGRKHA